MAGRERRSGAMQQTATNDEFEAVEIGDPSELNKEDQKAAPSRRLSRLKKVSTIISEEEIRQLREQDYPKPQKPIYVICIAVFIASVLTIIVVPAAYAGAKSEKGELVATTAAGGPSAALRPASPTQGSSSNPVWPATTDEKTTDMRTETQASTNAPITSPETSEPGTTASMTSKAATTMQTP